jgi:hypothetical protein
MNNVKSKSRAGGRPAVKYPNFSFHPREASTSPKKLKLRRKVNKRSRNRANIFVRKTNSNTWSYSIWKELNAVDRGQANSRGEKKKDARWNQQF